MVRILTTVSFVVEKGSANINNERQPVSNAKDRASVSMIGFALNASLVKEAVSVSMIGSNLRVRSAKEARSANMDGIETSVKNVVEHPCASMADTGIRAQNAKGPEYVTMENENSAAVNV